MPDARQSPVPTATLIIPQYGRADLTLAALRSLRRFDPNPWPVLIVDDGSPDDAVDRVTAAVENDRELLAPVQCLPRPHHGLSAAWNVAARAASTETLVFLNNDVVARGQFIQDLVAPLVGNHPPPMTGVKCRPERGLPLETLARLPCTTFLEGWCFAMTRQTFFDLDGFDEQMALYWSDTDFQCRLAARIPPDSNGAHSVPWHVQPQLPVAHRGHQTAHAQPWTRTQWRRDRTIFLRKWALNRPVNSSCFPPPVEPAHAASPADL